LDPEPALSLTLEAITQLLEAPLWLTLGAARAGALPVSRLKLVGGRLQVAAERIHHVDLELRELVASPFLRPGG